jgi:hypothetical protein
MVVRIIYTHMRYLYQRSIYSTRLVNNNYFLRIRLVGEQDINYVIARHIHSVLLVITSCNGFLKYGYDRIYL